MGTLLPIPIATVAHRMNRRIRLYNVFQFVKTAMPGDAPGSLTDDEYRAIIAFDLKANGVDLSGKDVSDETLAAINLH